MREIYSLWYPSQWKLPFAMTLPLKMTLPLAMVRDDTSRRTRSSNPACLSSSAAVRYAGPWHSLRAYRQARSAGTRRTRRPPDAAGGTPSAISSFTTVMARAADSSQLDANCPPFTGCGSVKTVNLQDPVHVGRDLRRDVLDGDRQRGHLRHALLRQVGAADRKQHLALEHEAVADDLDARPSRQHLRAACRRTRCGIAAAPAPSPPAPRSASARDWRSARPCRGPAPAPGPAPATPRQAAPSIDPRSG